MKRNLSVSLFLFILVIGFTIPRMATAEYCWFWEDCWDEPDDGPGITYDTISIKNGCYKPIHVAIKYFKNGSSHTPTGDSNSSFLTVMIPSEWIDYVIYPEVLYPGETTPPIRNDSQYWYYYAVSTDWVMEWGGDEWLDLNYEGETYPFLFSKVDSGTEFIKYTQTLTCD